MPILGQRLVLPVLGKNLSFIPLTLTSSAIHRMSSFSFKEIHQKHSSTFLIRLGSIKEGKNGREIDRFVPFGKLLVYTVCIRDLDLTLIEDDFFQVTFDHL